ncbi:protein sorting system archaetidylserine decarboxylase [Haladaptatus salinisoli]|uniref:protein sorting system archaetidylserine decarboxylase n=1 Tax=Haladaptatus salinisoli TaxID=2884876 RepID=UPI001D0A964B|nr:protein sorting system archaetidylserine decarboxylase [Haladaptatus salinisoli]
MRLAPGAWRYAAPPFLLAGPVGFLSPVATLAALALGGAVLLFFRDPERTSPAEGVLSPADGRVSVIREEDGRVRVGVFMNVTDVHVNRAPLAGRVESVEHEPGAHRPAFSKESDRNERVRVGFPEHDLTLIAGAFARRIHPYVEVGDAVERGERLGHIAFGSRADVLLPPTFDVTDVSVAKGERVRAGETVIAAQSLE